MTIFENLTLGKWYTIQFINHIPCHRIKIQSLNKDTDTLAGEWIFLGSFYETGTWDISKINWVQELKDLEDIQKWLPQNHVDKKESMTEEKYIPQEGDWIVAVTPENTAGCTLVKNKAYYVVEKGRDFVRCSDKKGGDHIPGGGIYIKDLRKALPEEIPSENTEETTEKPIEKPIEKSDLVGRYVKALIDFPNGCRIKKGEVGKIIDKGLAQFPSQRCSFDHHYNLLVSGLKSDRYELMPKDYNPKLTKDELLEEAHRRYPPGTVYKCPRNIGSYNWISGHNLVETDTRFRFYNDGNNIEALGKGYVYFGGKWADIIESPQKTQVSSPSREEILEEAKRRYPVGTHFFPAHLRKRPEDKEYCIVTEDSVFIVDAGNDIVATIDGEHWDSTRNPKYGNTAWYRIIYTNGCWAEILSPLNTEKHSEIKTDPIVTAFRNGDISASGYVQQIEEAYTNEKKLAFDQEKIKAQLKTIKTSLEEEYNSNVFNQEFKLSKPKTKIKTAITFDVIEI